MIALSLMFVPCTLAEQVEAQISRPTWFEKVGTLRFYDEIQVDIQASKLSLKDLGDEQYVYGKGRVLYLPKQFISPRFFTDQEFSALIKQPNTKEITINRNSFPHEMVDRDSFWGTVILRLENLPEKELAFHALFIYHPIRYFLVDEHSTRLLTEHGKVSQDINQIENFYGLDLPIHRFYGHGTAYIIAHVAGPQTSKTARTNFGSFLIGNADTVNKVIGLRQYLATSISGGFFIVTVFFLFIYLFRPQDRSALYIAQYALISFLLSLFHFFNLGIRTTDMLKIFTLLNIAAIMILEHYLLLKISTRLSVKSYRRAGWCLKLLMLSILISVGLQANSVSIPLFATVYLVGFGLISAVIFYGIRDRQHGILFFCAGLAAMALFQYPLVVGYGTPNYENGYYTILAHFFMMIGLALVNAREFSVTYRKTVEQGLKLESSNQELQYLSKNLELEVDRQTEKLRQQKERLETQKAELIQAHEDLQKLDVQKTRFFQNISHELRTPLTLILAGLKAASQHLGEDEDIELADRNAKRLLRLVNQLLDFQKLSQSDQRLQLKPTNLTDFLRQCVTYFEPVCASKSIRFLSVGMDLGKSRQIMGDRDALEKIVFNFLSNALKYTPANGEICLGLEKRGWRFRVWVKDSGGGIKKEDQDKLFKVFSQVDDSERRQFEGTGLGLALVKELAEKMDGSVGVDSEWGQGACFWAEFPDLDVNSHLDLLVVEDDRLTRESIEKALLSKTGLERFRFVETAEEGLEVLQTHAVACVLSDARLPGMNGPRLLEQVALVQPGAARLLMTSRDQSHALVQQAIAVAQIDKVLYKPLADDVYETLESYAKQHHSSSGKPLKDLLIVDDEPEVVDRILQAIHTYTLIEELDSVSSIKEAKALLTTFRYRIVLSDANLGQGDFGADLLAYVYRTEPKTIRVMLTAEKDPQVLGEAVNQAKVDHFFYKPLDPKALAEALISAIEVCSQEPAADEETEVSADFVKDWHLADVVSLSEESAENHLDTDRTEGDESKPLILVCDDVADMRRMMRRCLQESGFRVITANNGQEGFDQAMVRKPDLIITDWMMPETTGPELIQRLHGSESLVSIPTILLTAKSDDESKLVGTQVGATAYLGKPFDELELTSMVRNLVKLKVSEKKLAELNRYLMENVLQRFLPPSLVREIAQGRLILDESAKSMSVCILFCDICQFTEMSKMLGPERIAKVLNSFFESQTSVIFSYGGTIDKFIGDSVMAIFGAPEQKPAHYQIQQAVSCAVAMQKAVSDLNHRWADQQEPAEPLRMRIGIHYGVAVVGQFGSQLRSEYTAIGPTVNFAARVESVAQPGEILISESVSAYLASDLQESAGYFELRGIGKERLFRVLQDEVDSQAA